MKIRAVVKLPKMKAAVAEIENDLDTLQRLVGGRIETMTFEEDAAIICNEEWRILKLTKNIRFMGVEFGGPVLFVGTDGDEFCSVSENAAELLLSLLKNK